MYRSKFSFFHSTIQPLNNSTTQTFPPSLIHQFNNSPSVNLRALSASVSIPPSLIQQLNNSPIQQLPLHV